MPATRGFPLRQVDGQRERAARCFFPVISMYLLMGVSLAITNPYAHMRNKAVNGNIIGDFLIPYYIMARFCHLGQSFVRQVSCLQTEATLCAYNWTL